MSKKQLVIDTVFKQTVPFYSSTIMSLSGSSVALVNNTLNELISQGKLQARKDGKKFQYTLIDHRNNQQIDIVRQPICSMAEKFDYIRNIVKMVIDGINPSALIVGRSGVGKTHLVREVLENAGLEKDRDYVFASGHSSAFGLYKFLHDNRDRLLIMDDFDSVFKDLKSVNLLKAALDSYDVRRVSWFSEKTDDKEDIEPYFDFEGKIIFISNLYADRIDGAVKSRSLCVDLRMTDDEVTEHMQNLINVLEPKVDVKIKQEVLDFIGSIASSFESYGLRTLIQSIRIRIGAGPDTDWKKMIKTVACNS